MWDPHCLNWEVSTDRLKLPSWNTVETNDDLHRYFNFIFYIYFLYKNHPKKDSYPLADKRPLNKKLFEDIELVLEKRKPDQSSPEYKKARVKILTQNERLRRHRKELRDYAV